MVHSKFQSTRPSWGATKYFITKRVMLNISIHAPLMGRDPICSSMEKPRNVFKSTRPSWGATDANKAVQRSLTFQSTRPSRGATCRPALFRAPARNFNPRAPHGARRRYLISRRARKNNFNPRAPHGARLKGLSDTTRDNLFQSTRPSRGATLIRTT